MSNKFISNLSEISIVKSRINNHKTCMGKFHTLICEQNSKHQHLKAEMKQIDNKKYQLLLICPDCNYIQEYIPSIILNDDK